MFVLRASHQLAGPWQLVIIKVDGQTRLLKNTPLKETFQNRGHVCLGQTGVKSAFDFYRFIKGSEDGGIKKVMALFCGGNSDLFSLLLLDLRQRKYYDFARYQ